ncbi:transforming growth factor beta-1-induced transcript 1 protein isoform 4-T4 [Pangshura tecta]
MFPQRSDCRSGGSWLGVGDLQGEGQGQGRPPHIGSGCPTVVLGGAGREQGGSTGGAVLQGVGPGTVPSWNVLIPVPLCPSSPSAPLPPSVLSPFPGDSVSPSFLLCPRIVVFDALLADLETTTSHISKRPVLLTDSGAAHANGLGQDGTPEARPHPPPYNPQQQAMSVDSQPVSAPPSGGDKEHLYSTVCKPRSPRPKEPAAPPFSSSSGVLGAGLCELDRLLQELNATQFNITDEIMSQFPTNKSADGENQKEKPEDAGEAGSPSRSAGSTPPPVKPSATSATLELDKLMASLSDFRVQSNLPGVSAAPPPAPTRVSLAQQPVVSSVCPSPSGPPPAAMPTPQGGNLDSMLVMLQSDLSRQGISTSTKGLCASCQKPIAGQVVTALGNTWHPEHFVCTHCQKEMGGSNFFEKDGAPYCERDYFQLFSPRCGLCNEPILDLPE